MSKTKISIESKNIRFSCNANLNRAQINKLINLFMKIEVEENDEKVIMSELPIEQNEPPTLPAEPEVVPVLPIEQNEPSTLPAEPEVVPVLPIEQNEPPTPPNEAVPELPIENKGFWALPNEPEVVPELPIEQYEERKDYVPKFRTVIFFENLKLYTTIIEQAYLNNSSIKIKWESGKTYKIIFSEEGYPVCSCPSYYHKSFRVKGSCKHINAVITHTGIPHDDFEWAIRPKNLPLKMKNMGILEFQWINA